MKYIKKVIIDNFQSHEHSELDFDLGLNIIVGQSDKGKSAIIRAIKWVLYNEPRGTDFIRYGTNECSVTVVTGDNYTITRRRKTNKNIYTVIKPDGEKLEFENFGNAVPTEVMEATGVKEIKLDTDTSAKLNLNEQLDPPFLLSETGTMRAKAIGRIVNTNIIDAAERDIMKDISNNNLILKGFEKQLTDIDQELEQYGDIEKEEENLKKIENLISNIDQINLKYEKIREYKDKLQSINILIDQNKQVLSKLKSLPDISDIFNNLKEKSVYSQRLCSFNDKLLNINQSISKDTLVLENLQHLETVNENIKALEVKTNLCNKLSELNNKQTDVISKINKGTLLLDKLQQLEIIDENTKALESKTSLCNKLSELNNMQMDVMSKIKKSTFILEKLQYLQKVDENIKALESKTSLHQNLTQINEKQIDTITKILKGTEYMNQLNCELKSKISQYSSGLKQIGKCPTCFGDITDDCINKIINELEGELNVN